MEVISKSSDKNQGQKVRRQQKCILLIEISSQVFKSGSNIQCEMLYLFASFSDESLCNGAIVVEKDSN